MKDTHCTDALSAAVFSLQSRHSQLHITKRELSFVQSLHSCPEFWIRTFSVLNVWYEKCIQLYRHMRPIGQRIIINSIKEVKRFEFFNSSLCRDLNSGLPPYQGGTLPGCVTQANNWHVLQPDADCLTTLLVFPIKHCGTSGIIRISSLFLVEMLITVSLDFVPV